MPIQPTGKRGLRVWIPEAGVGLGVLGFAVAALGVRHDVPLLGGIPARLAVALFAFGCLLVLISAVTFTADRLGIWPLPRGLDPDVLTMNEMRSNRPIAFTSLERREEAPFSEQIRKLFEGPNVADAESWRRHTDRVKAWVRSQVPCLEANGIPNPGSLIDLSGFGNASLFAQHFKDTITPDVEEWNRAIVICRNTFRTAETRVDAEYGALGLIREVSGWPFRWMMIEHAAGLPVRAETAHFECADGAIFDHINGGQVHSTRRLTDHEQQVLLETLLHKRLESGEWLETLALGEAWRAVQSLRSRVRNDFAWIDTLERLPGECDRCPDRVPRL